MFGGGEVRGALLGGWRGFIGTIQIVCATLRHPRTSGRVCEQGCERSAGRPRSGRDVYMFMYMYMYMYMLLSCVVVHVCALAGVGASWCWCFLVGCVDRVPPSNARFSCILPQAF